MSPIAHLNSKPSIPCSSTDLNFSIEFRLRIRVEALQVPDPRNGGQPLLLVSRLLRIGDLLSKAIGGSVFSGVYVPLGPLASSYSVSSAARGVVRETAIYPLPLPDVLDTRKAFAKSLLTDGFESSLRELITSVDRSAKVEPL